MGDAMLAIVRPDLARNLAISDEICPNSADLFPETAIIPLNEQVRPSGGRSAIARAASTFVKRAMRASSAGSRLEAALRATRTTSV